MTNPVPSSSASLETSTLGALGGPPVQDQGHNFSWNQFSVKNHQSTANPGPNPGPGSQSYRFPAMHQALGWDQMLWKRRPLSRVLWNCGRDELGTGEGILQTQPSLKSL